MNKSKQKDKSCPHGTKPKKDCVECNWTGKEEIGVCDKCYSMTWHRQGKCLKCKKNEKT